MSKFVACIEHSKGFNTHTYEMTESSLDLLLDSLKDFASEATEHDSLCILGSTNDPDTWEAIEDCWETYVVPAIEKRELVKKIKLVEDNIAREELWFAELEAAKIFKRNYLEMQRAVLKSLKEQQ